MAEQKNVSHHWWLRMLVLSAALVVLLLSAYFLTPAVQLHYRAWRWRSGRDEPSLDRAVKMIIARRLERDAVVRLLGEPDYEDADRLLYRGNPTLKGPSSRYIVLKEGRAASIAYPPRMGGLRSLGPAILMYADDSDEVFPNAADQAPSGKSERK